MQPWRSTLSIILSRENHVHKHCCIHSVNLANRIHGNLVVVCYELCCQVMVFRNMLCNNVDTWLWDELWYWLLGPCNNEGKKKQKRLVVRRSGSSICAHLQIVTIDHCRMVFTDIVELHYVTLPWTAATFPSAESRAFRITSTFETWESYRHVFCNFLGSKGSQTWETKIDRGLSTKFSCLRIFSNCLAIAECDVSQHSHACLWVESRITITCFPDPSPHICCGALLM